MSQLVLTSITLRKDMLQSEHKGFRILCEYIYQRRQQGVRRDERASGPDLVDLAIRNQVQLTIVELSIDTLKG